jgi:hypothetical protein
MRGTKRGRAGLCPGQGNEARDGCPWMRTSPGLKIGSLLLVIAAHLWLGWTLANYRPDGRLDRVRARERSRPEEVLVVLNFESRIAPAPADDLPSPSRPRRARPAADGASLPGGDGVKPRPPTAETAALDLRPAPPSRTNFDAFDPLRHGAPALAFEATRYDKAWISNGNLTHVVARRSQLAAVVLGVLGALREDCTEKQRANYERGCVPDAYEHRTGNE